MQLPNSPYIDKEAISRQMVHKAMRTRATRQAMWQLVGMLKGQKAPGDYAANLARTKLTPANLYKAIRNKELPKSKVTRDIYDQLAQVQAQLMNRTSQEIGIPRLKGLLGQRRLDDMSLRPQDEWVKVVETKGRGAGFEIPGAHGGKVYARLENYLPGYSSVTDLSPIGPDGTKLRLSKPRRTQIAEMLAANPPKLREEFRQYLQSEGVDITKLTPTQLNIRLNNFAKTKKNLVPDMGDLTSFIERASEAIPTWGGMATMPGHAEVAGLYGHAGFMPTMFDGLPMLVRKGGKKLPGWWDKLQKARFRDAYGTDPTGILRNSVKADTAEVTGILTRALNKSLDDAQSQGLGRKSRQAAVRQAREAKAQLRRQVAQQTVESVAADPHAARLKASNSLAQFLKGEGTADFTSNPNVPPIKNLSNTAYTKALRRLYSTNIAGPNTLTRKLQQPLNEREVINRHLQSGYPISNIWDMNRIDLAASSPIILKEKLDNLIKTAERVAAMSSATRRKIIDGGLTVAGIPSAIGQSVRQTIRDFGEISALKQPTPSFA